MDRNQEELDLLRIRPDYLPGKGWDSARKWLFNPQNDDQVRMGVERLLENDLIADFIKHADVDSVDVKSKVPQWGKYKRTFERIKSSCDRETLAKLLWSIFIWAKSKEMLVRAMYLKEAVGVVDLVNILGHKGLLKPFLNELIQKDQPKQSLLTLKHIFDGIEKNPRAAAILVLDFIYAVRDLTEEDKVLSAFFEGFDLSAKYGLGLGMSITWTASPMLKAMANLKGRPIIQLYENFIRDLFTKARSENSDRWVEWQREYDHEFLFWTNVLQSGRLKPDRSFEYNELQEDKFHK